MSIEMPDVFCPHCEEGTIVCTDDGHGCNEDEVYEEFCPHCEKRFALTPSWSVHYSAEKAPCMNGSPHNFRITETPRYISKYCIWCNKHEHAWKSEGKAET